MPTIMGKFMINTLSKQLFFPPTTFQRTAQASFSHSNKEVGMQKQVSVYAFAWIDLNKVPLFWPQVYTGWLQKQLKTHSFTNYIEAELLYYSRSIIQNF